jgi:hypothetical protein
MWHGPFKRWRRSGQRTWHSRRPPAAWACSSRRRAAPRKGTAWGIIWQPCWLAGWVQRACIPGVLSGRPPTAWAAMMFLCDWMRSLLVRVVVCTLRGLAGVGTPACWQGLRPLVRLHTVNQGSTGAGAVGGRPGQVAVHFRKGAEGLYQGWHRHIARSVLRFERGVCLASNGLPGACSVERSMGVVRLCCLVRVRSADTRA